MTKRAAAVILLLLIIPAVFAVRGYVKWKKENRHVAEYGESIDEIIVGVDTYKAVKTAGDGEGEEESFLFELGEFVGKVGGSLTGAPLYRVKNDTKELYYALVGEHGPVLYSESGRLEDVDPEGGITALSFNSFRYRTDDRGVIGALEAIAESKDSPATFVPSDYATAGEKKAAGGAIGIDSPGIAGFRVFRVRTCLGGSAVATGSLGRIVLITGRNRWYFISDDSYAREKELSESAKDSDYVPSYSAQRIEGIADIRMLKALLDPDEEAQTTAAAGAPELSSTAAEG